MDDTIITKCNECGLPTAMATVTLSLQPTEHNCSWGPQLKPLFRDKSDYNHESDWTIQQTPAILTIETSDKEKFPSIGIESFTICCYEVCQVTNRLRKLTTAEVFSRPTCRAGKNVSSPDSNTSLGPWTERHSQLLFIMLWETKTAKTAFVNSTIGITPSPTHQWSKDPSIGCSLDHSNCLQVSFYKNFVKTQV